MSITTTKPATTPESYRAEPNRMTTAEAPRATAAAAPPPPLPLDMLQKNRRRSPPGTGHHPGRPRRWQILHPLRPHQGAAQRRRLPRHHLLPHLQQPRRRRSPPPPGRHPQRRGNRQETVHRHLPLLRQRLPAPARRRPAEPLPPLFPVGPRPGPGSHHRHRRPGRRRQPGNRRGAPQTQPHRPGRPRLPAMAQPQQGQMGRRTRPGPRTLVVRTPHPLQPGKTAPEFHGPGRPGPHGRPGPGGRPRDPRRLEPGAQPPPAHRRIPGHHPHPVPPHPAAHRPYQIHHHRHRPQPVHLRLARRRSPNAQELPAGPSQSRSQYAAPQPPLHPNPGGHGRSPHRRGPTPRPLRDLPILHPARRPPPDPPDLQRRPGPHDPARDRRRRAHGRSRRTRLGRIWR